jgi:glycosyltransferase involved in cell wall biosynthesis
MTESGPDRSADAPRVVVLLLTCNRPVWAEKALRSVVAQTFDNFTVLVRDNSTDAAVKDMVERLADPRVRYTAGLPRGQFQNFVGALSETDEELFLVLHDDDWWEPNLLENLLAPMLADPTLDVAYGRFRCVDEAGEYLEVPTKYWIDNAHQGRPTGPVTFRDDAAKGEFLLLHRAVSVFQATVIRRSALRGDRIPEEAGSVLDLWLSYILFRNAERFHFIDEELMAYRVHGGSVASEMADISSRAWCVEQFLHDPRLAGLHARLRRDSALYRFRCALAFLAVGRDAEARSEFRKLAPDLNARERLLSTFAPFPPTKQAIRAWLRHRNPRLRTHM